MPNFGNARSLKTYLSSLNKAYSNVDAGKIDELINLLKKCQTDKKQVFLCGNGGSASTADHAAIDLGVGSDIRGAKVNAISLTANNAILTAVANDLDFTEVFVRQLSLHGNDGDVLIVISASGNSENLIEAVKFAKEKKIFTVAVLGFDGGALKNQTDLVIHVRTDIGEYGIVEDIHLSLFHYVTERIRQESRVVY